MKNPQDEWMIFENTHEAIVDRETWELAQKLLKTPRRTDTIGTANPLTGLMYCADCGAKMYNHRSRGHAENGQYPTDSYECSNYSLAKTKRFQSCFSHYIGTKAVRELVLETIRTVSAYSISNREEFQEKIRSASQLRQEAAAKDVKRKLIKDRKRIDELDSIIKKLYESFAVGRISEERFDSLLKEYEDEQKNLIASAEEAEKSLSAYEENADRAEQFLILAKKYTDFSELTTQMINEFIEKIVVHAPERIDGDRVQEIEIYLNFIGRFDVPAPEPTDEELKRQEQSHRRRVRERERYRQLKAGERTIGEVSSRTCASCGKSFETKRYNAVYCSLACQKEYYRKQAAAKHPSECTCEICGTPFPASRGNLKFCSDACRAEAKRRRQKRYDAQKQETEEKTA